MISCQFIVKIHWTFEIFYGTVIDYYMGGFYETAEKFDPIAAGLQINFPGMQNKP